MARRGEPYLLTVAMKLLHWSGSVQTRLQPGYAHNPRLHLLRAVQDILRHGCCQLEWSLHEQLRRGISILLPVHKGKARRGWRGWGEEMDKENKP